MRLRYTRAARRGLAAQLEWLVMRSPAAARRAADDIDRKLRLIAAFPLAAPAIDEHHREAFIGFGRDGFVVRYRVERDDVLIVEIFHGRQTR